MSAMRLQPPPDYCRGAGVGEHLREDTILDAAHAFASQLGCPGHGLERAGVPPLGGREP
ncbi:hypothetical protein [Streptomyces sp. NPDC054837]